MLCWLGSKVRAPAPPQLTPAELAEKEQVLVALRLVSFKLNVAQRKAQGSARAELNSQST